MNKMSKMILTECSGEDRKEAENFIKDAYASAYGANLEFFMPRLMKLRNNHNELLAACGMRSAKDDRLFLEKYIDKPIEQIIRESTGEDAKRNQIVEIGNLAVSANGIVRKTIIAVINRLYEEGYDWVAFTGTKKLLNSFRSLGLDPVQICKADPERLDIESRMNWGSYFDNEPVVMIGNIQYG